MSFDLTTGGNSALCGIYLEVGEEYLIDLYRNEFDGSDRLQAVGSCGMARRWSMVTEEDQELLRGGCESYDPCEGVCGEFQARNGGNNSTETKAENRLATQSYTGSGGWGRHETRWA